MVREGSRWTDVFSLTPGRRTTIGRSSGSHIVIRHERCSRQHAELFAEQGDWIVRDNASRNGTRIDAQPVHGDQVLQPGQTLEIAGCQMVFVHEIADAFEHESPTAGGSASEGSGLLEEQQTVEGIDAGEITHRQRKSPFLEQRLRKPKPNQNAGAAQKLFQFAFDLSRCESIDAAAESALDTLIQHTGVATGAVMRLAESAKQISDNPNDLVLIATRQRLHRSYHRVPDFVAQTVLRDGEAVLARNIADDAALASPDSRGEISTTSTLCAPIRVENRSIGLIHLYSSDDEPSLEPEHLEFALAVAENLGLAFQNLMRQAKLATRLDRSRQKVDELRHQLGQESKIVGDSPEIRAIGEAIRRAAPTSATVLIRGESGVGKELVAQSLHDQSNRSEGPFLCLNCAALSPALLESELFGHEKGAFTGATERKLGKFEAADGGTLMLDEIGEMSPEIQAKFLRVLEGHPFERVGGNRSIRADVRVVSATNRDLEAEVRAGRFRADLYFRLHVLEIVIPPLRQRGRDILRLANYFLKRFCQQMGRKIEGFTVAAEKRLMKYPWPGNIRELKNVIERAVVLSNKSSIDAEDLVLSNVHSAGNPTMAPGDPRAFEELSLLDIERNHILQTLRATEGNKSKAASILGIERSTLDRKLKRFELTPRDWID
ncbi:Transcriptional regulatory protein ZraR [Rosistilla carotiformis]|uniref:Transcriptional regulatory protein ZraR n=1 Tax=Rosistilla carotiformis TaxID=2528017 RepID=A0A518JTL5_9BACT|nr:sigma 54-interacting transcriptional regulator [Rosistilla carotiformis]QDV68883.1 Transcriptional regulatory protein ZraR [Rosistilla carotiformis]